jgi:hypothetical protein
VQDGTKMLPDLITTPFLRMVYVHPPGVTVTLPCASGTTGWPSSRKVRPSRFPIKRIRVTLPVSGEHGTVFTLIIGGVGVGVGLGVGRGVGVGVGLGVAVGVGRGVGVGVDLGVGVGVGVGLWHKVMITCWTNHGSWKCTVVRDQQYS